MNRRGTKLKTKRERKTYKKKLGVLVRFLSFKLKFMLSKEFLNKENEHTITLAMAQMMVNATLLHSSTVKWITTDSIKETFIIKD